MRKGCDTHIHDHLVPNPLHEIFAQELAHTPSGRQDRQGKGNEKIDGFTPDQRFFLSWAQVWRANTRPEELASRLKTDPHSPSELRCNMTPGNMEAWYKAFNIKPTDKAYRAEKDRARVW